MLYTKAEALKILENYPDGAVYMELLNAEDIQDWLEMSITLKDADKVLRKFANCSIKYQTPNSLLLEDYEMVEYLARIIVD